MILLVNKIETENFKVVSIMKKMTGSEIRKMFLDFFESKGHMIEPGASLVPHEDPTLLWINSGVAAVKKYFDGSIVPKNPRIVNAQKSIRTNDIENVGHTARHHTFFEMLGNFSIGEYFREDAVIWGWELLTSPEWFAFDKDLLYVTVYPTDEDTYNLWIKIGVDPSHIIRLEDNFWEIGTGPCGPCTEIFFDRGVKYDPEDVGIKLIEEDIENDRYIEIWNIVLSQFNSSPELDRKDYPPLPSQNIDTGMGLERMACILQDVPTNFETDLFMPIIEKVSKLSGSSVDEMTHVSFKIIADHIRTVTFAVSDGALPSNEGRGYVLRRLLRRALMHGRKLAIQGAFLSELVPIVVDIMKDFYPELVANGERVQKIIKDEEERFLKTLADGHKKFIELAANQISGRDAFMLYDTYGFPYELTAELAKEYGLELSRAEFDVFMKDQQERARRARGKLADMNVQNETLIKFKETSEFIDGYEGSSKVILLLKDGEPVSELNSIGQVILDKTPFYATSGGQIADTGVLEAEDAIAMVVDVSLSPNGQHLHTLDFRNGSIRLGQVVSCKLAPLHRVIIEKNHTATHLLHSALKKVLGDYANQAGSLVSSEYLRFDFTHSEALSGEEVAEIEKLVNSFIFEGINVEIQNMTLDEAKAKGAAALFGEKYEADDVRVVIICNVSTELCGGTHVKNTSEIGMFKITSESGIGAGIRRIEAVTFAEAYRYVNNYIDRFNNVAQTLKSKPELLETRAETLMNELSEAKRENESLKAQLANSKVANLINEVQVINGYNVLTARLDGIATGDLKKMIDEFKQKLGNAVIVLASVTDSKVSLVCGVCENYVKQGLDASEIVKEVAKICGGNGGGRSDMATAGARDITKIEESLAKVMAIIEEN